MSTQEMQTAGRAVVHLLTESSSYLSNGLFSRITWVSRHQKGKRWWVTVAPAGSYADHLHLASDR